MSMPQSDKLAALVRLADTISHELNNIFTAVVGNLSLLDESLATGHAPIETIQEARRSVQRGIELSAKLQAFAGRQTLNRRRVNIRRVVESVLQELRPSLSKYVSIKLSLPGEDCCCTLDEDKFRAVIIELILNAQAAMESVGRIRIEVRPTQISDAASAAREVPLPPGPYAWIGVTDSGPGMTIDEAANAMDPLFTTKPTHINKGWGLANAAGFVRQSGGCIALQSEKGRGTRVDIHLPLAPDAKPAAPPVSGALLRTDFQALDHDN